MASTGINNGTKFVIFIDGSKVAYATSNNLNVTMAVRNATTKDSGGWTDNLEGVLSWDAGVEGNFAEDASFGYSDLFSRQVSRSRVGVIIKAEVGDNQYAGNAYITSLQRTSPTEENETFSATLTGTGALIETVTT